MKRVLLCLPLLLWTACLNPFDQFLDEGRFATRNESADRQQEETLEATVELSVGSLEISAAAPGQVYSLELHYMESASEPDVKYSTRNGDGHLEVRLPGGGRGMRGGSRTRLSLQLGPDLPLRLKASMGVGEGRIDLSKLSLESLAIESGVGETRISMLEPNPITCERLEVVSGVGEIELIGLGNIRFRRLVFKGGIGASKLDFSGEWTQDAEVEVDVGIGGIEVRLPRNVGAEVDVTRHFLSNADMRGFTRKGDRYISENHDRVEHIIRFRVRAGIGGIEFRWH